MTYAYCTHASLHKFIEETRISAHHINVACRQGRSPSNKLAETISRWIEITLAWALVPPFLVSRTGKTRPNQSTRWNSKDAYHTCVRANATNLSVLGMKTMFRCSVCSISPVKTQRFACHHTIDKIQRVPNQKYFAYMGIGPANSLFLQPKHAETKKLVCECDPLTWPFKTWFVSPVLDSITWTSAESSNQVCPSL